MKNNQSKAKHVVGNHMATLLNAKEISAVSGGSKGPVPAGGGNPTTNIPHKP